MTVINNDKINYISSNIDSIELNDKITENNQILSTFQNAEIIENHLLLEDVLSEMLIGIELWRYILYALILLVILEMYLSNHYYLKNE